MFIYILRRLALMVFVLWGVTVAAFVVSHVVPADPAAAALGNNAREEQLQAFRVKNGLDKPMVVTATTLDGLTYTLKLGRPSGDNYYATIAIAGDPRPEGKDAGERLKKISERLPREKALADYTLLVPKSKLEDVVKKRAELLAKKEEKKQ